MLKKTAMEPSIPTAPTFLTKRCHRKLRHNKLHSLQLSRSSSNSVHATNSAHNLFDQLRKSIKPVRKKRKSENMNISVKDTNYSETMNISQSNKSDNYIDQQSIEHRNLSITDLLKNFKATANEILQQCQKELKDDPTKASEISDALQAITIIKQSTKLHTIEDKNLRNPLAIESLSVTVPQSNGHSQNDAEINSLLKSADTISKDYPEKMNSTEPKNVCKPKIPTNLHNDVTSSVVIVKDIGTSGLQDKLPQNCNKDKLKNGAEGVVELSDEKIEHITSEVKKIEDEDAESNYPENKHNTENLLLSVSVATGPSSAPENLKFPEIIEESNESLNTNSKNAGSASELINLKELQISPNITVKNSFKIVKTQEDSNKVNSILLKDLAKSEKSINKFNVATNSVYKNTSVNTIETSVLQDTDFEESKVAHQIQLEDTKVINIPINPNKFHMTLMKKGREEVNSGQTKNVCKCHSFRTLRNDTTAGAKITCVDSTSSQISQEIPMQELIGLIIEGSEEYMEIQKNIPQIAKIVEQIVDFKLNNCLTHLHSNLVQATEQEADCVFCNPQPGPSTKDDNKESVAICKYNHHTVTTIAKHNDGHSTVTTKAEHNDNHANEMAIAKHNDHGTVTTIAENNDSETIQECSDLYQELMELEEQELIPNVDAFTCEVCLTDCEPGEGVMLHRCLHTYCRECLANLIRTSEDAQVKCPYRSEADMTACNEEVLDSEIRMLISEEDYEKHVTLGLRLAETAMQDAFHCRTPSCPGWCVRDTDVTEFRCPCCYKINCLCCMNIHTNETCHQYKQRITLQENFGSSNDEKKTKEMIDKMLNDGEAMKCYKCNIVVTKEVHSCDWVQCGSCRAELCWATKGPRWGPGGCGDTSGGCKCKVGGLLCHPQCQNCH